MYRMSFHWLKICHGDLIAVSLETLETPRAAAAKRPILIRRL